MQKLVRVGLVSSFMLALLPVGTTAATTLPVTVLPGVGSTTEAFTIAFTTDRDLSPSRFLEIKVVSAVRRPSCEHTEFADITYARKGQRIVVVLRPIDKSRWCPGIYRGTVGRWVRASHCGKGVDNFPCTSPDETRPNGNVVGRFQFRITH